MLSCHCFKAKKIDRSDSVNTCRVLYYKILLRYSYDTTRTTILLLSLLPLLPLLPLAVIVLLLLLPLLYYY